MRMQEPQWATAMSNGGSSRSGQRGDRRSEDAGVDGQRAGTNGFDRAGQPGLTDGGTPPLRVDAQRNLEHVLRAAREVFSELGYGAPMEDVARRARVGVGTVYRRFPSKNVLVRRIAEEETARLTEQARAALGQEDDPWAALSRFLRASVASGAGRLLPPEVLQVQPDGTDDSLGTPGPRSGPTARTPAGRLPAGTEESEHSGVPELLSVVGELVDWARGAGELRQDVTVADVLLVIATAAPSLPDAAQHAAAAARLLDILLDGLRWRPAVRLTS